MPSASFQSRIQAFEALSSSSSTTTSPPDNRTSNLLESPISPTASTFQPITPSPSTPSLVCQTSFVDLKDWIVEDGPTEHHHPLTACIGNLDGIRESNSTTSPTPTTPLISFEPPPKSRPPLPPRKHTSNSPSAGSETLHPPGRLDSLTIEHTYPPGAHKFGARRVGHAPASSVSSFHSVSLSSDGSNIEALSSKPPSFTLEADSSTTDVDTASIAESFESVSAPSAASPSTVIPLDWEQAISKSKIPPKLEPQGTKIPPVIPPKPLARSASASSSSTATSTRTRRPPPPPPYQPRSRPASSRASIVSTSASTSDRSSILSNVTTTSRTSISTRNSGQFIKSTSLLRSTPVPPVAQSRYESLFDSAVQGRRKAEKKRQKIKLLAPPPLSAKKGRQAAGWRGLSVDLITNPKDHPILSPENIFDEGDNEEEESSPVVFGERLNGRIVKYIWSASRLDREKLRSIWNDCDPQCTGFVDRDAFVKGMWRIDEELRRAQLARRTSALAAASSQRIPHRPLPPPRPKGTATLLT